MKKLMVMLAGLLVLASCQAQTGKNMNAQGEKKVLVTYFSASGVTRGVAQQLADVMNADLYEITPEKIYTDADLDWTNKKSRSSVEMNDLSSRPAIKNTCGNMAQYETVFIGFPIWWYTAPTIINTFIEAHNLSGKVLIPFATSGGSTIQKSCEDLKRTYPDYTWKAGKLLNRADKATLESWKKELGL